MTFYVGQKVVCVDDSPLRFGEISFPIKLHAVCTIKRVIPIEDRSGAIGLQIEEADSPISFCGEYGFSSFRFRPVLSQGMEILKRIAANPPKELIREEA